MTVTRYCTVCPPWSDRAHGTVGTWLVRSLLACTFVIVSGQAAGWTIQAPPGHDDALAGSVGVNAPRGGGRSPRGVRPVLSTAPCVPPAATPRRDRGGTRRPRRDRPRPPWRPPRGVRPGGTPSTAPCVPRPVPGHGMSPVALGHGGRGDGLAGDLRGNDPRAVPVADRCRYGTVVPYCRIPFNGTARCRQ